jgi:hypothetical protein
VAREAVSVVVLEVVLVVVQVEVADLVVALGEEADLVVAAEPELVVASEAAKVVASAKGLVQEVEPGVAVAWVVEAVEVSEGAAVSVGDTEIYQCACIG